MIKTSYCEYRNPQPQDISEERISDLVQKREGLVWVDFDTPSDSEIEMLQREFGIHPLAIEDIVQRDLRPKFVDYGEYILFVIYEVVPLKNEGKPDSDCVGKGTELHLFVGRDFFVSVHYGKAQALDATRKRWQQTREPGKMGPYYLLYLTLDSVIDDYFPALDSFDDRVEALEDRISAPAPPELLKNSNKSSNDSLKELITLRHNLITMRRIITPLRDAVNILLRRVENIQNDDDPLNQDDKSRADRARTLFAYFQDIYDHTIRIVDLIDTYRDILSALVDAHLAVISNRTNEIMKVLTSVSIILMSIAAITGWYGMNFEHMPELHWRYGYAVAAAASALIAIVEWSYFRGRGWL